MDRFERFSLAIFRISRHWNIIAAEEMKRFHLRGAYALYLVTLAHSEEMLTAAQLASVCLRDKADVSRAVAAFQEKGLLEPFGESTYRAKLILTEKGRAVANQVSERATVALRLAGGELPDEKKQVMYECLECIENNLQILAKDGLPQ